MVLLRNLGIGFLGVGFTVSLLKGLEIWGSVSGP